MNRQRLEQLRGQWTTCRGGAPVYAVDMGLLLDALLAKETREERRLRISAELDVMVGPAWYTCDWCGRTFSKREMVQPCMEGLRCYENEQRCALIANWSA